MPAKEVIVSKNARKSSLVLPPLTQKRLANALRELQINPLAGRKLQGELQAYYKYRVGDYRIVYSYDHKEKILVIHKVEHRQGIYK